MAEDWHCAISVDEVAAFGRGGASLVRLGAISGAGRGSVVALEALEAVASDASSKVCLCDVAWAGRTLVVCGSDGTVRFYRGAPRDPCAVRM